MVEDQSKSIIAHGNRLFIAPLALTVFIWVFFMNALDLLPVDMPHYVFSFLGLSDVIHNHRIVPTADLNGTMGLAFGVVTLMMYYSFKLKGPIGFIKELLCAPFGSHPSLWIFNLGLNIIEFVAKTFSIGMRLLEICTLGTNFCFNRFTWWKCHHFRFYWSYFCWNCLGNFPHINYYAPSVYIYDAYFSLHRTSS